MKTLDCIQGSPEWHAARLGKVTASRIADVMSRTKAGKFSAKRADYLMELVCERLTGNAGDHFVTRDMAWGIDNEDGAAELYSFTRDVELETVGLVYHPNITQALASPDRLVGDDGLIEIKCPKTTTHFGYLMSEEIPEEYKLQIYWQLECTGRRWCDFVSFDPRMPGNAQMFVRRIEANPIGLAQCVEDVNLFLEEVDKMEQHIINRVQA